MCSFVKKKNRECDAEKKLGQDRASLIFVID